MLGRTELRALLGYLRDNLHEDVTLDDLAAQATMSKYHLLRTFKRSAGTPAPLPRTPAAAAGGQPAAEQLADRAAGHGHLRLPERRPVLRRLPPRVRLRTGPVPPGRGLVLQRHL